MRKLSNIFRAKSGSPIEHGVLAILFAVAVLCTTTSVGDILALKLIH